jgi:2-polyprenyl-3-methyl-5-hydroxy-6-metoxy-1,4-benzoquinol methylase
MKILVTIANYGTKNDAFLQKLLDEYNSMSYQVHLVVLTNVSKNLGQGVQVVVETPNGNPWSFPFAHRKVMADRIREYDLFIYSEDDTLIKQQNIDAFLEANQALRENEIAGFVRSERTSDGYESISTVHAHFHWDPCSIVSRGQHTFAHFTNEHSGSYILIQEQLSRAIRSGGYLVPPHQGKYHLPETAATDPYTQCGFRKMICISRIGDFILPHLPNKYVGKLGLGSEEFLRQIQALEDIRSGTRPSTSLLDRQPSAAQGKWGKKYYEPTRQDLTELIPQGTQNVMSYGCGWGALEKKLVERGMDVTAIPLDAVIGACAEVRGLKVVYGTPREALKNISNKRFDCIVATDMLHLHPKPEELLISFSRLLTAGGRIVVTVPNLQQLSVWWRRISRREAYRTLGSFARSGIHLTSHKMIRDWFKTAGLRIHQTLPVIPDKAKKIHQTLGSLSQRWLASEFLIVAGSPHSESDAAIRDSQTRL